MIFLLIFILIYQVTFNGNPTEEAPTVQCIKSSGKPMLTIQFLTDQLIVGAGHEFNPTLHASLVLFLFPIELNVKDVTQLLAKQSLSLPRTMLSSSQAKN